MKFRSKVVLGAVLGAYVGLIPLGIVRDGTVHTPTFSHCFRGVDASICLGCTWRPALIDLTWGPKSFRMTARGISLPGLTLGSISNTAGVCTEAEATTYGEKSGAENGPDDGPAPPQEGFAWAL